MAVRQFKPTTPGQRGKVLSTFDEITARKIAYLRLCEIGRKKQHRKNDRTLYRRRS